MKIGDYVRTKYGIAKIIEIYKKVNAIQIDKTLNNFTFVLNEDINKTSPNIIDLIEIGDIITFKDDYVVYNVIALPDNEVGLDVFFLAKHYDGESEDIEVSKKEMEKYINSIVTKEQFESMEYKVGEDNE